MPQLLSSHRTSEKCTNPLLEGLVELVEGAGRLEKLEPPIIRWRDFTKEWPNIDSRIAAVGEKDWKLEEKEPMTRVSSRGGLKSNIKPRKMTDSRYTRENLQKNRRPLSGSI
jgi:hypothetical protein